MQTLNPGAATVDKWGIGEELSKSVGKYCLGAMQWQDKCEVWRNYTEASSQGSGGLEASE